MNVQKGFINILELKMYELNGWFVAIVGIIVALAAMGAIMGGTIGIIVLAFKLAYGVFV